jgi:tetratricopeptide (TPR) repeat protein
MMDLLPEAMVSFALEEFADALAIYDEMIALVPNVGELYALRADVHGALANYDEAIGDLLTALEVLATEGPLLDELAPDAGDVPALQNNLCWFYGITGDPESALPYCEAAVAAEDDPAFRDSRGLVYAQLDMLAEAAADFQMVVDDLENSASPGLQAIREERLGWLEALGEGENPIDAGVLAELRGEVVEAPPPEQTAPPTADLVQQGRDLMQTGQLTTAIDKFSQAIAENAGNVDAYYYRGMAYRFNGQLDLALADFDHVIAASPGWADAFYERGITYGTTGNFERAIQDYSQAISLNPNNADYYSFRGLARLTLGQIGPAIEDFSASLSIRPDHALTLFNRGFANALSGDAAAARADLQRALELGLPPSMEEMARDLLEMLP